MNPLRPGNTIAGSRPEGTAGAGDTVNVRWLHSYSSAEPQKNDQAYAIAVDRPNSATYLVGATYRATTAFDLLVIKFDALGDTVWTRTYGNNFNTDDFGTSAVVDPSGNLLVAGITSASDGLYDILTLKYTPDGSLAWARTFDGLARGDDAPAGIAVDPSGNVYVAGSSTGTSGGFDMVLLKYNAAGTLAFSPLYNSGNTIDDVPVGIRFSAGVISIGGNSTSSDGNVRMFAVQYNPGGTQRWAKEYNAPSSTVDEATAMTADDSGTVVLTGRTYDSRNNYNYLTVSFSNAGSFRFADQYDGPAGTDDEAYGVATDKSGNIFVTGGSAGADASLDFATIKYSPSGVRRWLVRLATPADDIAYFAATDRLGNVYVCGAGEGAGGSYDLDIVKYSSTGQRVWDRTVDGGGDSYDYPTAFVLDGDANIVVCGNSSASVTRATAAVIVQRPFLRFSTPAVQFGNAFVGGVPQSQPVTIANDGSESISVTVHEGLIPDFYSSKTQFVLSPLDSLKLELTFAPVGSGIRTDGMTVAAEAVNAPYTIAVAGSGTGTGGTAKRVENTFARGWQLISQPVQLITDPPYSNLYSYNGTYVKETTMTPGPGYWNRLPDTTLHITGYVVPIESVHVAKNWNLMGSLSNPIPVSAVHTEPPDIISGSIFGYIGGTYVQADSIKPGRAYWVKVTSAGTLYIGP